MAVHTNIEGATVVISTANCLQVYILGGRETLAFFLAIFYRGRPRDSAFKDQQLDK